MACMSLSYMISWCRRHKYWRAISILFLGQLVSFVLALESLASSLISELGVNTPLTQSFFTYLTLAVVYGSILLYRRQKLLVSWYWYVLIGFVDVQGNYLVNEAYQFSSITSVTLLDCCTIVWVIILTQAVLGTRYSLWQFLGAGLCVVGLGLVFLSDAGVASGGGSKPLLGDTLVIVGTVFYAMSNVGEEFCVKKKDLVEVIAMLGVFGTLVSVCEIAIIERKRLESVKWSTKIILAFLGYASSCSMFYALAPFVLKLSGSAMFNLSILTSDMWAVVFRIFLYQQEVDWLYFVSFAVVVVGIAIYSTKYVIFLTKWISIIFYTENELKHSFLRMVCHCWPLENDHTWFQCFPIWKKKMQFMAIFVTFDAPHGDTPIFIINPPLNSEKDPGSVATPHNGDGQYQALDEECQSPRIEEALA